jgi:lysophospholipase L1-like esterase
MIKLLLKITIAFAALYAGESGAQDWANLKRYQQSNARLTLSTASEHRVVYMGDSITDFWINNDSTFFSAGSYLDRGISGQTTGQMLLRFRQDVIALRPAVVVILAGINDIAQNNGPASVDEILGNIISMTEFARANRIKVVLASLLPAFRLPWRPAIDPVPQIDTLNKLIRAYADKNHLVYLDYFNAMADSRKGLPPTYTNDEVHPNLAGYKVMEPLVENAIEKALQRK